MAVVNGVFPSGTPEDLIIMASLEARDPGLHDLVAPDAPVDRIAGGLTFTEGPVWRRGALLFSDIPNKRVVRWRRLPEGPELMTFATGMSNGLTLDRQGRVLAAEHDGRRVSRVADDGTRTVLAEHFQGKRLNSPNDIVVKSDGSVYFTDPPYAACSRARPVCLSPRAGGPSPSRARSSLATACTGSPRRGAQSGGGRLRAAQRPRLLPRRVGALHRRVWVCRASGALLGRIVLPELPANLAWGEDGSVLFLTARTSVYRLPTRTRGSLPG
jgi:gluconolactonase